jgi:hypothetical protein
MDPYAAGTSPSSLARSRTLSTRVLQIFTSETQQALFTYPEENLHRLTEGAAVPPSDAQNWMAKLFYPEDYQELHEKLVAVQQASMRGHDTRRHVCSRLRFNTEYGTRVAECVVSSWGQLIFVCTQLVGNEADVLTEDGMPTGVGVARPIVPVSPPTPMEMVDEMTLDTMYDKSHALSSYETRDYFMQNSPNTSDMEMTPAGSLLSHQTTPSSTPTSPTAVFGRSHRSARSPTRSSASRRRSPYTLGVESRYSGRAASFASASQHQYDVPAHSSAAVPSIVASTTRSSPPASSRGHVVPIRIVNRPPHQPTALGSPYPQPYSPRHPSSYPPSVGSSSLLPQAPLRQRETSGQANAEGKQCESCGTTRSPEWRRGPSGHKT